MGALRPAAHAALLPVSLSETPLQRSEARVLPALQLRGGSTGVLALRSLNKRLCACSYGGMENPCLSFVTPTLLAGDRSLANVVAHELAHSWTGAPRPACLACLLARLLACKLLRATDWQLRWQAAAPV